MLLGEGISFAVGAGMDSCLCKPVLDVGIKHGVMRHQAGMRPFFRMMMTIGVFRVLASA